MTTNNTIQAQYSPNTKKEDNKLTENPAKNAIELNIKQKKYKKIFE